jgi:starch synthase
MSDRKLLYVTQELDPYTAISSISKTIRTLPQYANENGYEVRILMPRYGVINERRHRLHEVVRLSGMNIIVDDEDYPLIIKVASLPGARLQVYFLDNEEFFKRKFVFQDEEEKDFEDNQERMVFFCKGVMEIIKKFGWPPDVIHCHGPLTSLVPFYVKSAYQNDPVFQDAKLIYSIYDNGLGENFDEKFFELAAINDLDSDSLSNFNEDGKVNLHNGGIYHSDALIIGNESLSADVLSMIEKSEKPLLPHMADEELAVACLDFYDQLIGEEA